MRERQDGRYDLFSADPEKLKESLQIIADLEIEYYFAGLTIVSSKGALIK